MFLMPNICSHGFLQSLKKVELAIANKVFVKNAFPIEPSFSSTLVKTFGASAENVDFLNEATVEIINSWVAQQTKDKIKNLIKPGMPKLKWLSTMYSELIIYQSYDMFCFVSGNLDENTRLVLVNSIYFNGEWDSPFFERCTRVEDFFTDRTHKVQVPMMHRVFFCEYAKLKELNAQIVELPYKVKIAP